MTAYTKNKPLKMESPMIWIVFRNIVASMASNSWNTLHRQRRDSTCVQTRRRHFYSLCHGEDRKIDRKSDLVLRDNRCCCIRIDCMTETEQYIPL